MHLNGYHPHRGVCVDVGEKQSLSQAKLGHAYQFWRHILGSSLPTKSIMFVACLRLNHQVQSPWPTLGVAAADGDEERTYHYQIFFR